MKRRITLSVLAALILALVGLPTTAHYRAKARAEAYRLQLKASGESTKVADFRPVLSPEEVRTGAELVAAANRFRLVLSNAPTMKFLAPGRALAACREEVLPTDESTNVWPGLEFLLAQNEDALARVRAVLAGSTGIGFHLDYSVWPNLPLSHLAGAVARSSSMGRLVMVLMAFFAGSALLLAAIGVYGLMSYTVSRRTHEIGIRMALGAVPGQVLKMVLFEGSRLLFWGLAFGLPLSWAVGKVLAGKLYRVSPFDAPVCFCVGTVLTLMVLAACYLPARRAAMGDPLTALRYE